MLNTLATRRDTAHELACDISVKITWKALSPDTLHMSDSCIYADTSRHAEQPNDLASVWFSKAYHTQPLSRMAFCMGLASPSALAARSFPTKPRCPCTRLASPCRSCCTECRHAPAQSLPPLKDALLADGRSCNERHLSNKGLHRTNKVNFQVKVRRIFSIGNTEQRNAIAAKA